MAYQKPVIETFFYLSIYIYSRGSPRKFNIRLWQSEVKTDAKYTFMELNSNYMLRLVPGALHTNLCVELEVCTNQEVL